MLNNVFNVDARAPSIPPLNFPFNFARGTLCNIFRDIGWYSQRVTNFSEWLTLEF